MIQVAGRVGPATYSQGNLRHLLRFDSVQLIVGRDTRRGFYAPDGRCFPCIDFLVAVLSLAQGDAAPLIAICDQSAASPLDHSRPEGIAGVAVDKVDPKLRYPHAKPLPRPRRTMPESCISSAALTTRQKPMSPRARNIPRPTRWDPLLRPTILPRSTCTATGFRPIQRVQ